MEPTADPGALDAAARAVRRVADQLEGGASLTGTFSRQASASPWKGQAADKFRHTISQDANAGKSLAADLRSIAAMIEAGASKIRAYRAKEAQLQKELQQAQQKAQSIKQQMGALRP